jgi:hypothetical protein
MRGISQQVAKINYIQRIYIRVNEPSVDATFDEIYRYPVKLLRETYCTTRQHDVFRE